MVAVAPETVADGAADTPLSLIDAQNLDPALAGICATSRSRPLPRS
jgi:hypothetical protein